MPKGSKKHVHGKSGIPLTEDGRLCPRCEEISEELGEHMKTNSVATGFFGMDGRMWVWDGKDGTEVWPKRQRN